MNICMNGTGYSVVDIAKKKKMYVRWILYTLLSEGRKL
jgi:hypothetical protein